MKVSFFLTRPLAKDEAPSDRETSIYARLCYSGFKFKYYIPESINPRYWNKESQRAKETQKFKEYPEFNARLNHIEATIKNVHRKFINDNAGTIPLPKTLRPLLDKAIRKIEVVEKPGVSFFSLFDQIIEQSKSGVRLNPKTGKPLSKHTFKTYVTVKNHLTNFQKTRKKLIDFSTIDFDFYSDYTEYLMKGKKLDPKSGKEKLLNLSTNTIGKHIKTIKIVLNEATEKGINTNLAFKSKRFATLRESSENIYLNIDDIRELEQLDLSGEKRLDRVRDLFIVACYTGLRYSDFSVLRPEHIKDGFIEIEQSKTGSGVVIPVHNTVRKILDKYNGELPQAISNQKTNAFLKEIGKKIPSLKAKASYSITKGGTRLHETCERWELMTSHTGRRSFATNEYLAGTPPITIMAITGHRSEKTFLGYIKLTPNEHAKLLKLHWQKRNALVVI